MQEAGAGVLTVTTPGERHRTAPSTTALHIHVRVLATCDPPTNRSWTEIDASDVPAGRRLVRMTWAYKTKRSGKLKARLCIQGCSQVPGVDYDQTFCATMRSGTLRVLCAAAVNFGLNMRRWDFVAAYLQGELEEGEVIYTVLSHPGLHHSHLERRGGSTKCW